MTPNTYVPRPHFIPFHNRPHRWAVLSTHRRAGKTVALVNDIILAARTPLPPSRLDPQYAYVGPTYKQAKRIAWGYLKRYSSPYWSRPPSESELKVTLNNNAVIYCLGADNADSLRGMYLDGFVGDEYALWRPSVFSQVIRPALSDRNGWGVFSSTPRGKNLFHQIYRAAIRDPDHYFLLTLRASQSKIIPPAELADLRKHMDEEEFAQEYECSFDAALKGAIYPAEVNDLFLTSRTYTTPLYDPALDTHFVYDLGFTDATVRIAYQLPPLTHQVNIVSATARSGVSIFEHLDDLHSFPGPLGTVWLPHDARARNLQTGKSIIEQFLEHGITPRIVPHHHVHDGISTTRRLFPHLHIDCTPLNPDDPMGDTATGDLIEAMKGYRREWDEDKKAFDDIPYHDWTSDWCDALRYLAVSLPSDFLPPPLTSDNALQSARAASSSVWTPKLGYNLETLHLDHAASSNRQMP